MKAIPLHGSTSTSKNLDVALNYSKCAEVYEPHQQPVLIVTSIFNKNGFYGFRMSDKRFSVYPYEQEYLLMEGFEVYVLGIQDKFKISNKYLPQYDNKVISIIYL